MATKKTQSLFRRHEPLAIVAIAALIAASLFTFEIATGLPASVRGAPMYNALPMPAAQRAQLRARARLNMRKAAAERAAARRERRTSSSSSSVQAVR